MAELQLFQPGKTFYDSFQQGRGNTLAKLAITGDQTQRKGALADLYGLNPEMAQAAQGQIKANDEQDYAEMIDGAKVMYAFKDNPEMAGQAYARFKPRLESKYGIKLPEAPDATVWNSVSQIIGAQPKELPNKVQEAEWAAKQQGLVPGSEEYKGFVRQYFGADGKSRKMSIAPDGTPYIAEDFRYWDGGKWVDISPNGGGSPAPQTPEPKAPHMGRVINEDGTYQDISQLPPEEQDAYLSQQWNDQRGAGGSDIKVADGKLIQTTPQMPSGSSAAPPVTQAAPSPVATGGQGRGLFAKPKDPVAPPSGYQYNAAGTLEPIKGGPADPTAKVAPRKAWTPAGMEKYYKVKDDVQVASTINTMMDDMTNLFNDPDFELGPVQNKRYELQNWRGQSTPQSRAYAKLSANFEKMRNDSLRLNAGVQTDGDAQRAWNEIMANMNDKELVKSRLADIKRYNEFALLEKRMQLEGWDAEFGAPGSQRQGQPAQQPQAGGGIRVQTKQEYDALPSGTDYIGPDGKPARKK
jgi:hypothetical protein